MIEKFNQGIELEIREDERLGPMLRAVILQEGRAASGGRSELFAPGSSTWSEQGIEIKVGHNGEVETLAHPVRSPEGGKSVLRFEQPIGSSSPSRRGSRE